MTLAGNATAPLVLVAVLVACLGYAAGRLHQWYRTEEDRDEAYREGYDTATRSTFSLAARIIGPRRERSAARGSATVHGSASLPDPVSETPSPASAPASAPARDALARPLSRAAARSRRFHSIFPSSSVSPSPPNTASPSIASRPAKPSPPSPSSPPARTPTTSPSSGAPGSPDALRSPLAPGSPDGSRPPLAPSASSPAQHVADEPVAAEPVPAAGEPAPPSGSKPSRPGRHFVPDELVRAATYRLTPDRVARAKVPTQKAEPADDGDPASHPPVPKPRSS